MRFTSLSPFLLAKLLLLATALFLFASCSSGAPGSQDGQPQAPEADASAPNIIYVMADELGYYELSLMGHDKLQTPQIDRLAREGMRFTQCLAGSSVCAPTRACLMTGKHSGHTSVRSNGGGTPLRAGEPTVASVLKRAGYATGGFGKWGCGGRGSTGVPEAHGFDRFFGYYDQVHAHSYYPPYLIDNSKEYPLAGNDGRKAKGTYSHYVIFKEAMRFIRENQKRRFFCYLPVTPPHGRFEIPDTDPAWKTYKDKPWPEQARRYAAMVSMLDRQVGEILGLLKELGLDRKTIVFFCGDNGGNDYFRDKDHPRGFHAPNVNPRSGVAFRGTKGTLYEGGLRIPMLAYWPGRIAGGTVNRTLCYFPDVLPTLAELAGAHAPTDVDGISLVPSLLGEATAGRTQEQHEYLYWEIGQQTAVRAGDWKALRAGRRASWQLFNLARDISETRDLAPVEHARLKQLVKFASEAHEEVREGSFASRALHEKDRRAGMRGFGGRRTRRRAVQSLPKKGLLPRKGWKVLRVSSENRSNGRFATCLLDGDPRTHWHTRFGDEIPEHPHEVVVDMGRTQTIAGFVYLARQDAGWNGTITDCEFYAGDDPATLGKGKALVVAKFRRTKKPQTVRCKSTRARYFLLRSKASVGAGPWASGAELAVLER